jgi:hypothetical protein
MIELNKRQYEILTFMANTGVRLFDNYMDGDVMSLISAGLCIGEVYNAVRLAPHTREMFRDAGLRRVQ